MKISKIQTTLLITVVLSIFLSSFVSAVGVSQPYWEGYPLKIAPGETKTVDLKLQNMVGSEDITMKASLIDGAGIASLDKEAEYLVKAGTSDTIVPVTISIQKEATPEEKHIVKLGFNTVTPGGEGVAMGIGYTINFDVLVVAEKTIAEEPGIKASTLLIIAGIIVLTIVILVVLKKRQTNL